MIRIKERLLACTLAALMLLSGCTQSGPDPGLNGSADDLRFEGEKNFGETVITNERPDNPLSIYAFDAGRADAFLLWTKNGAVIIDSGEAGFGSEIVDKVKSLGISKIDCLIVTHFDFNHAGGASEIIDALPVDAVLQTVPREGETYDAYCEAIERAGITPVTANGSELVFQIDGVSYTVDPPHQEHYDASPANNSTLIISVGYGNRSILFTSDAEDDRLNEFMHTPAYNKVYYDLVMMPDHGSFKSSQIELAGDFISQFAVITCSKDEPADQETVDLLSENGIATFFTSDGGVTFVTDGSYFEKM